VSQINPRIFIGILVIFLFVFALWARSVDSGYLEYHRGQFEEAMPILSERGARGDPLASFLVGRMYSKGRGGPIDHEKSGIWYLRAASQGSVAAAYYYLRQQLATSPRATENCVRYRGLLETTSKMQDVHAYSFLSHFYMSGLCGPKDTVEAAYYLHLASGFDRRFGVNKDGLVGMFSDKERERYANLLRRDNTPVSTDQFLEEFSELTWRLRPQRFE